MADELLHQRSETEYKIRINGGAVRHYHEMNSFALDEFAQIARDNPDDYVDIVSVRTEILVNQYSYSQMKRHYEVDRLQAALTQREKQLLELANVSATCVRDVAPDLVCEGCECVCEHERAQCAE